MKPAPWSLPSVLEDGKLTQGVRGWPLGAGPSRQRIFTGAVGVAVSGIAKGVGFSTVPFSLGRPASSATAPPRYRGSSLVAVLPRRLWGNIRYSTMGPKPAGSDRDVVIDAWQRQALGFAQRGLNIGSRNARSAYQRKQVLIRPNENTPAVEPLKSKSNRRAVVWKQLDRPCGRRVGVGSSTTSAARPILIQ